MNRQIILTSRPTGVAQANNFEMRHADDPVLADGQIRVANRFLSVEPAMRGWIADVGNYSAPVGIGEVMRSLAVGEIVESRHPDYAVGTIVTGWFGWQERSAVEVSAVVRQVTETDLPLSLALGVLGINGVTAHYGLLQIGQPRAGETVVVSTAAGSVGSAVGQIARLKGCRTVGITGGEVKRRLCLDRFGYDAAVDYKAPNFMQALAEACGAGVDVYFDNTAGAISDAVMARLKVGARVVICGTASMPNWNPAPQGPRVERHLLVKRARMQGFVIFDHPEHHAPARADLATWVRSGQLQYVEEVLDGIDHAPDAIAGLYRGDNLGKRLIRLH